MFKKMIMLAAAVGALAALPVAASANWTDGTVAVANSPSVDFTGQAKFNSGFLGSIECQTKSATQILSGQTTGTIKTFEVDGSPTEKCATGGALAGCQVHTVQSTELHWFAHIITIQIGQNPKEWVLDITNGEIHNTVTGGFCPTSSVTVTKGTVLLTPDNPHAAKSGSLSGELQVHSSGFGSAATTISGTQNVQGAASGTYGIT